MSKLVGIKTYERFRSLWENNDINEFSLNFILDTGQLYTHGIFINSAVFGTTANGAVSLSIAGTTNTLALSSHTHSDYYDKSDDLNITNHKIISGLNDLLFCSGGTLYLGNTDNPTYISGSALYSTRGQNSYTILDTGNFEITNTLPSGYIFLNTALIKYGGLSHQIDYVKRINTSQSFDYLHGYTQAGTNQLNGIYYGYINFTVDNIYNNPAWAQLRINISSKTVQYRTSVDANNWIDLGNANVPLNSLNVAGIVSAPTIVNANKIWKTDNEGNPGWRDEAASINSWRNVRINDDEIDRLGSNVNTGTLYIKGGTNIDISWVNNKIVISNTAVNTWQPANAMQSGYVPSSIRGKYLHANIETGDLEWTDDKDTWKAATNSLEGYVPKLFGSGTITNRVTEYVLTFINTTGTLTPKWKLLPKEAFKDSMRKVYIDDILYNSTKDINFKASNSILLLYTEGTNYDTLEIIGSNTWRSIYVDDTIKLNNTTKGLNLKGEGGITLSFVDESNYGTVKISSVTYSTATNNTSGLIKVGTTLDNIDGYTALHIKDGIAYYKDTDTWNLYTAPTTSTAGIPGYIVPPTYTNINNFLRGDGTWQPIEQNVTSALYVGSSSSIGNSLQETNGNVYLIFAEGSTYSRYRIVGSGRASVTCDSNGNITIDSAAYSNFSAATPNTTGTVGLVPAPGINILGDNGYFLRADGIWAIPTNTWDEANTNQAGYIPQLVTGGPAISGQTTEYVLTYVSTETGVVTPKWKILPSNAFKDTWNAASFTLAGYVPQSIKGKYLHANVDNGSLEWIDDRDTTYNTFTGASATDNGNSGLVTAPTAGDLSKFLKGNGTWDVPTNTWRNIYVSGTQQMTTSNSSKGLNLVAGNNISLVYAAPGTGANKSGNNAYGNITITATNTWIAWQGASSQSNGTAGYMPAPTIVLKDLFLRGDGQWVALNNYSLPIATNSTLGGVKIGTTLDSETGFTKVHIKDSYIYYHDTTYSFYNLKFLLTSGTDLMTYNSLAMRTVLAGDNITFTYSNNVLTIKATDTTYSTATSSALGLVKVGDTISDATGYTACKIKDGIIYYKDTNTTYTFYNLQFQNSGGTTVDTYKPNTSPTKTLKAGNNVTISAASNVITIASTNTWNANAVGVAGYVAAPTKAANANMTWLTDADGNPAWRSSNNHSHSYLPLTGGTISNNNWGQQLTLKRENGTPSLYFNDGSYSYYIYPAMSKDNEWHVGSSYSNKDYILWHSGNFDPLNYLAKTGGTITGSLILKGNTTADMTYASNIHPRLRFINADDSQSVDIIYTDYDSYRVPAGIKIVGNQGNEYFEAPQIYSQFHHISHNNDDAVLLAGGGWKLLSDFGTSSKLYWANIEVKTTEDSSTSPTFNVTTHNGEIQANAGIMWRAGTNIRLPQTANNQEWSFDIYRNGYTGGYWHVWDTSYGALLSVYADNGNVLANRYLSVAGTNLNYTFYVNGSSDFSNRLVINSSGQVCPYSTDTRRAGMYGNYDSNRIAHIWSIGTSFMIPDNGSDFGNLYGLACKHTNNSTGGTMAGGHQAVWCDDGNPRSAMGYNGFWTKGTYKVQMDVNTSNAKDGLGWTNTSNTVIGSIQYHNTEQRIIINSIGSGNVWDDTFGKSSLRIGKEELTYNGFVVPHTYPLYVYNGTNTSSYWRKLGTFTTAGNSNNMIIDIFSGPGYNGTANQNVWCRIIIKDGWQSSPSVNNCLGITVEQFGYPTFSYKDQNDTEWQSNRIQVRVNVTSRPSNSQATGELWILCPWDYANGNYTVSGHFAKWTHNGAAADTSASNGNQTAFPTHNQNPVQYMFNVSHMELGRDNLTGWGGSFFFGGNTTLFSGEDYVGLQAGNNLDKWQLVVGNSNLQWRQNDTGNTNTSWGGWRTIVDSNNWTSIIDGRYLPLSGGIMTGNISFKGAGSTYQMIKFKSSTSAYGQGIVIGGGGMVAIGGGESSDVMAAQYDGENEVMMIGNDGAIDFHSNLLNGWSSRKTMTFNTSGNLTGVVGYYTSSDIRLKQNISDINCEVTLNFKSFNWKEDNKPSFGLIAQEVELNYPELIELNGKGYKEVNYTAAFALSIAQLQKKVKELEQKIKLLEIK